jgi:hypothetical protein
MGLWDRLIGSPATQEKRQLVLDLQASYRAESRLAKQVREHAAHAPHQAGAQMLHTIAAQQDQVLQLLREKLTTLGGTADEATEPVKTGKNHWARVLHDIEDNQALERHYLERVAAWEPDFPDAVALYRGLAQEKAQLNVLLRDVALRADPHALD